MAVTTPKGYRLVQVFLSRSLRGSFEVAVEWTAAKRKRLHCTCPGFARGTCTHVRYVRARMVDGVYPANLSPAAYSRWDIPMAQEDQELFRYLMLLHSEVVVL